MTRRRRKKTAVSGGRIREEFEKLKTEYGLPRLRLRIRRSLPWPGVYCRGLIELRHKRRTKKNLLILLHEFCHAIQDSERRLIRPKTFAEHWQQEREAWRFSSQQYGIRYLKRYGATKHRPQTAMEWHSLRQSYLKAWLPIAA